MDNQLKDGQPKGPDQQQPIDLLRRVFIPIEYKTSSGDYVFRTTDGQAYRRGPDGSIRRIGKKKERRNASS